MDGSAELLGRLKPSTVVAWVPRWRAAGAIHVGHKTSKDP